MENWQSMMLEPNSGVVSVTYRASRWSVAMPTERVSVELGKRKTSN
jgi:hypothetical protein